MCASGTPPAVEDEDAEEEAPEHDPALEEEAPEHDRVLDDTASGLHGDGDGSRAGEEDGEAKGAKKDPG